jgi:hypothetical protein
MTYAYRVFVEDANESSVAHFASEKLWDGATFRVSKPGHELDGRAVVAYRVVSHPTEHGPGIAYARRAEPGRSEDPL